MAKEKDPKINRVTVYRTLKMLKAGGLVDELDLMHYGGDQHYYETRTKQEHAHVICLRCGKVEEFFGDPLQRLRRRRSAHFGFQIVLARTEVGGYCQHCQVLRAKEIEEARDQTTNGEPYEAFHDRTGKLKHAPRGIAKSASLVVVDPSGHRSTVTIVAQPFRIGRQAGNQVVMRDNRASRVHAEIVLEKGEYWLRDLAFCRDFRPAST